MDKKIEILFITFITLILLNFTSNYKFASADFKGSYPYKPDDTEIIKALEYLKNQQSEDGGIGGITVTAWAAMAISSAEENLYDWGNLINYLEEKSNLLDNDKATDWERHTLAIVACNKNPSNFAGIDFIEKIIGFYDGTQIGDTANLFDDYFGIISLISSGMEKNDAVIQNTKSFIISNQDSNGGWGNADSTAAAIMALITAGENNDSKIISDSLSYLKTLQTHDGGFHSWGDTNAASTSWAVMAIKATNNNPTSNEWKKNGYDPIDYLLSLQQNDGSFNWSKEKSVNPGWMTSYAIPALLGSFYPVKINESGYRENNPPNKPNKPSGPNFGEIGISYTFTTSGTDPDNDRVQYRFDWDDGILSDWTPLVNSGESRSLSKTWSQPSIYSIRAQTRDLHGLISEWSNEFLITIKRGEEKSYWTGIIRVEGKNETIWNGRVTVRDTLVYAKNVDTEKIEEHYISHPSLLGALDEASKNGKFSYNVEYFPNSGLFSIIKIKDDSDWWHCWIDYKIIIAGLDDYKLTDRNTEILLGYLESKDAHALKISINKSEIEKNEKLKIFVFDENNDYIENCYVYVGSDIYSSDENGSITVSFNDGGLFETYAEKDGFVRSKKEIIKVEKSVRIVKPISNCFYLLNYQIFNNIKRTFIIGAIDILVETSDGIDKIDFYINNKLVFSDELQPFKYRLNEKSFFNNTKITVKSYSTFSFNYENLIEIIKIIIDDIKSIHGENDLIEKLYLLKNCLSNFENTVTLEKDNLSIEIIVLNLFPNLHNK